MLRDRVIYWKGRGGQGWIRVWYVSFQNTWWIGNVLALSLKCEHQTELKWS